MEAECLRLLLIEDNPVDARLIEGYLACPQDMLVQSEHAHRLSAGLARLTEGHFDCVLVDLNLPDSLGVDTVAAVRGRCPQIPIVVLTGLSPQEFGLQAIQAGADDYLAKNDLEPKLLVRTIRYAIERAGHRRVRQQYQEREIRYRTLFEQSPDGILLIDPQTLQAVEFNDAACRHLGYSREEFGRLSISDYEAHEAPEQACVHAETLLRAGRDDFETRHRTKTGEIRHVLVAARTVHLSGKLLFHCLFHDVTERKQAEDALRTSEQRYRQLLEAVTTYTYSVSLCGGVHVATQHTWGCLAATGYSPEEYAGDPFLWFRMVHPEDRWRVRQYVAHILRGEKTEPIEHRICHKNGRVRWIRNTIVQRRDPDGLLVGYDGLVEDVSERKEAEWALRERESHLLAAQAIQTRLWPKAPPAVHCFDVAGASYPTAFAAGDYFDYIPMLDGSVLFAIGDVAGHGLGPAIVMALTCAHLRSLVQVYDDLGDVMTRLNRFLAQETDHFVTLLVARLTPNTRSFAVVNAGHPPAYLVDASGGIKAQFDSKNLPLAVLPDVVALPCAGVSMAPGDLLFLFTDGIPEARSPQGSLFGKERMLQAVCAHRDRSAKEIIQTLYGEVQAFCRPGKPCDDMTAIVIKAQPDRKRKTGYQLETGGHFPRPPLAPYNGVAT